MGNKIASDLLKIARELLSAKSRKKKTLSQKDRMKIKKPSKTRGTMPPPSFSHKSKKDYNRQQSKKDMMASKPYLMD